MFKTIKRIIGWCGEYKGKLYLGDHRAFGLGKDDDMQPAGEILRSAERSDYSRRA